jgi:hypothetical protein
MTIEPLDQPWRFFRLVQQDGSPYLFYRCPACGATIDWRDHDRHLLYHGVTNSVARAELVKQQEKYAGVGS